MMQSVKSKHTLTCEGSPNCLVSEISKFLLSRNHSKLEHNRSFRPLGSKHFEEKSRPAHECQVLFLLPTTKSSTTSINIISLFCCSCTLIKYIKQVLIEPIEVISKLNISTQDWTDGKVYFCIVSHDDIPTPIRKKIFKEPVEYRKQPSVYLLLPSAEELSAQQSVTLSCLVKNFAPKEIFVEWTVNDQSIDANKYKNTEVMADSADGNYSMYSMLSISAGDWDRGYSYSCVVGHETFPLKTLTRAVNKSSEIIPTETMLEGVQQDERDNLWPTASTFIILFFLSIFYSATVTLFKVE
uniref:Ig-like domain-containing protein n=1 Tax=Callorhinchus milii TaxID=7868 RepID=A0A4W3JEY8_CALMI